ncbi:uncharacterized protein [Haliotis cracherodii]|uniref:uncharacterized protein n=1 Tax=Haliotis cracherodii TaxID=6455 RepID=UPI0039E7CF84
MKTQPNLKQLLLLMAVGAAEKRQEFYSVARGYRLTNPPMSTVGYKPSTWSAIWCLGHCLASYCASASFSKTEGICELHNVKLYDGDATFMESNDWVYLEPKSDVLTWDGWTVVFRARSDTRTSIYAAWLNDAVYHDHPLLPPRLKPGCFSSNTSRPCDDHFRSKIVTTWEIAGVQLVKVVLMKNSRVRSEIIFNGTGTNKMSWFSPNRVINSTWTDLTTSSFMYFSITGHPNARRFAIIHDYISCPEDLMWMMVIDGNDINHECLWDNPGNSPKFLYTTKSKMAVTGNLKDFEYGDAMVILVKFGK